MGKINIKPYPSSGDPDYAHLQPVVDFLIGRGNTSVNDYLWGVNRTGFFCHLANEIDFEELRANFTFPDSVKLNAEEQSIDCHNTYSVIRGGKGKS